MDNTTRVAPDVSVIITTYNVERFIEHTLYSALSQEDVALEVIVADDCSTDNTWALLSQQTDPRLTCIRLERNGGPSAARNAAIAQAKGAWIAVLDGDDSFLPGRLAQCVRKAKAQQADIVVDNLLVQREVDGKEFPMFPPEAFARIAVLDLAMFIDGNKLFSSGYTLGYVKPVFSSVFLRKNGLVYDEAIRIGEDYLFLAAALACGARCVTEPNAGYRYLVRAGSISHRLTLADIDRMLQGDARLMARYTFPPQSVSAQKTRERYLKKAYAFTQLIDALKGKNIGAALKAIMSYPSCIWLLRMPIKARLKRLVCSSCTMETV